MDRFFQLSAHAFVKIPSALGCEDMMKGYFLHKFNTPGNEEYVGTYPEPYYYGYDSMSDGIILSVEKPLTSR